jgi:hypothetical protein
VNAGCKNRIRPAAVEPQWLPLALPANCAEANLDQVALVSPFATLCGDALRRTLRRLGWCDNGGSLPRRLDDRAAQERAFNPRERLQQFYGLSGTGETFARLARRRLLLEHSSKIDNVRM